MESAIRNNKLADPAAQQLWLKVPAALANAKAHPSNLTSPGISQKKLEHHDLACWQRETYCSAKHNGLPYQNHWSYKWYRDPSSSYKNMVIELLQRLEKDKTIDRPLCCRLYPRKAIPCIYGLSQDTQGRSTTQTHQQQHQLSYL